ncbi:PURPLE ACID PHOSPHATASE [Salix koriyanagi]|uniref:Purple acid phosphatase n=1 Tax=Salix koriyanagi TaxID=2511006 RepID=A0A9Q0PNA0_9ROSI|nr:PURPLE ACID PHOSPHATASE [Salix koriyanagi]
MGVLAFPLFLPLLWRLIVVNASFPTTLEGPFKPVTVPFDNQSYHGNAIDLPDTDPQIQRTVQGFEPEQVSVSLSSDYDSVWISWITGDSQIGDDITPLDPESVYSVVQYGIKGSQMSNEEVGYSLVYNQLYPFEGLQNYTSGIIHHVRLTGLEPSTLYQYQCGDPYISAMSDVFYFRTMPPSSPTNYPHRVAVVGDLGLTYNTSTTFGHLLSNHPDLLVLVGGISYADMYLTNGTGSDCYPCSFDESPIHETYQPRWDYWGRFMQPLVANVPTMLVGGKHEIEPQAEDQIFVSYSSRFAFPSEESGSSSSAYYSFNAGGIHFVILNPYTYYDKSSDQYEWLEGDLDNVNRNVTPWLVAVWYPPWYSTFKAQYREAECMRVEMEDLLYEHGVDIVFNGHVHAYERSNRVYNYSLDPCGPVYITVGNGGSREDIAVTHADDPDECPEPSTTADLDIGGGFCGFNFTSGPGAGSFCWDRQPEYSAYRESSFGHGILEVKNETHALWSWHRNRDYYETAGDILYIVREPDRCLANQGTLVLIWIEIGKLISD